jgi:hypothetical protein
MYWTSQSCGCHKGKSKVVMCMPRGHCGGRKRMEVQLYSFLALALDTGEYSACLNGSAAGNRAPGTPRIRRLGGIWLTEKNKIMSYNSSIRCIYIHLYMTSGFRHNVHVICALTVYYTVSSENSLPVFQDSLLVPPQGRDQQVILKHQ